MQAYCATEGGQLGESPQAAAGSGTARWSPVPVRPRAALDDRPAEERAALAALTARETDVLRLVATGLSNGEIAERLYVSTATVKTHVNRAMSKVGARDRAQLVVFAYESGLARPGWAN